MKSKILSRRDLVKQRYIHLEEAVIEVERFKGGTMTIERLGLVRPRVVGVMLYNTDEKTFVMTRQFRYSALNITGGWVREIVAGVMDKDGETPEECAVRESIEESGYSPAKLEKIQMFMPSVGISDQQLFLFYGEVTKADKTETGGGLLDEGEDIEVVDVPLAELKTDLANGAIFDVKTLVAAQWFMLNKLPTSS